jgi:spermidine synthase
MTKPIEWISEKWENLEIRYRVKEILQELKTDFQHIELVDTYQYGKMLLLDGMVQTTEKDEFIYHEMMTHVPLLSHPNPEKVLIIGGGDGGVLREVLKYDSVEKATIVEIDPLVVGFCKKHLPAISKGAFDNERTQLIIADGADYIRKTDNKYDIVIVDSPDPVGPAQILFSKDFYRGIYNVMRPGGIMVRQTGSPQMQPEEQKQAYGLLKDIFQYNAFYLYAVPTYVGGLFSALFSSDTIELKTLDIKGIETKYDLNRLNTKYYSPRIHYGAFQIPPFMEVLSQNGSKR